MNKILNAKNLFALGALLSISTSLFSCGGKGNNPITPVKESEHNFYENPTHPIGANGDKLVSYIADPFVVRDGENFYLYSTQTDVYTPSLAFKRGPIWTSNNMVDWQYVGDVFANYVPTWGTPGAGVWAPTVIKLGDTWNFYYSLSTGGDSNPGIGVATSPTPYGPWTHYGKLFNSEEIGVTNSIDPYVFVDDEKVYMAWGSYGGLITLIELTSDGLGLKGGLETQKENKIALAGFEVFSTDNYEGTFIFKYGDYYYILLSTGTCCSGAKSTYKVVCAKSKNLTGPYLDSNGKDLFGPKRGDVVVSPSLSGAMGTGHCAVMFDDLNTPWMIYHGYDVTGPKPDSRVLYMDKLIFDDTGYPHVDGYLASNHELKAGPYLNHIENAYE